MFKMCSRNLIIIFESCIFVYIIQLDSFKYQDYLITEYLSQREFSCSVNTAEAGFWNTGIVERKPSGKEKEIVDLFEIVLTLEFPLES